MRWIPGGRSRNLEDRRGARGFGIGGMGIGGLAIALLLSLVFGVNPLELLDGRGGVGTGPATAPAPVTDPAEEPLVEFTSFVLDDAQAVWRRTFSEMGTPYRDAKLVLFRDRVASACGSASSLSGPFYCPQDEKVYVDLAFFRELRDRFAAPGDFAQAYVLAHELGHHVQNLLGIDQQVRRARRARPDLANPLSVRLELQADCLAGVWGHSTRERQLLEQGDVAEGLGAAAAVGDDRLQRETTGAVHPESFTHGTSAERVQSFRRGLEQGSIRACEVSGD